MKFKGPVRLDIAVVLKKHGVMDTDACIDDLEDILIIPREFRRIEKYE